MDSKYFETQIKKQAAIDSILNMSDNVGRAGCTYGDTDFDSLSVVHGYNTALEYIKDILKPFGTPDELKKQELVKVNHICLGSYIKSIVLTIGKAINNVERKENVIYLRVSGKKVNWIQVDLKTQNIYVIQDSVKYGDNFVFKNLFTYHGIDEINEINKFINDNISCLDLIYKSNSAFNNWESYVWESGKPTEIKK